MSLTTRLDKLEAALRGREPPDEPWICCRLIYDPLESASEKDEAMTEGELSEIDRERISRMRRDQGDRSRAREVYRASHRLSSRAPRRSVARPRGGKGLALIERLLPILLVYQK
jgi:hypothetical protein